MQLRQSLTKNERLCSKKLTAKLFNKSRSFNEFPFKVVYFFAEPTNDVMTEVPVQVLFTVSKRFLKKAVSRNATKRIMREAYRKNKIPLHEILIRSEQKMVAGIIYTGHKPPVYDEAEQKIILIINRLVQEVSRNDKINALPPNIQNIPNTLKNNIN